MEKKDILLQLVQHYTSGNKTKFAKMIGLTPQAFGNMIARNTLDVERILTNCVGLNPAFLLTGEGNMLLDEEENKTFSGLNTVDIRINELLTISSNLSNQYAELNTRLSEAMTIVRHSQEQFDRVLTLFEKIQNIKSDYTTYNMVAEK